MKLRKVKWILFGLATLVVAVVVAGYAVLASLDFEQLRGRIQAEAKKATGRDLVIAGPIDLQISLQPAIALEDVRFANAEWGSRSDMVTLDRFEIEVALLPLLSGEIAVRRLVLVAPDILLETDESGRSNWQMAAAGPAAEEQTPSEGPMTLPTVNEFLLENARLVYRAGDGAPLALRIERMTARTESAASPLEFALQGRYNDAPFEAEGMVGALQGLLDGAETPFRLRGEAGGATVSLDGRAEN
ncbi:MAG TPA: AsmA family protein, partial [Kiloniellales bacterium]|nr:AsmA family protein [Kiloniellales bacterium]